MSLKYQRAKLLASTFPTILPIVDPEYRRVLDLGCGSGDTLLKLGLPIHALLVGLDLDFDALKALGQWTVNVRLVCGSGELLPFKDECFDLVFSKVALPYMNIPATLREVNRVLREGGQLWMTLHPFRMAATRITNDLKVFDLRDCVYQSYVVANGFALEWLGRQFRFPANRRRCESVQSVRGIARALSREGFCDVQFEIRNRGDGVAADAKYGKLFVVSARKPLGSVPNSCTKRSGVFS
jgi:SAM-dependent methyltransferase